MLLFTDTGKLIFRDEKLQVVPEGNAAEDCWCCDPVEPDNCFLCKDPDSDNYNKKFYGGTTSVVGFPNEYEAPPHFSNLNPGTLFGCRTPIFNEISYKYKGLDAFNGSWTVQPSSPTDCTNLNEYEKFVKITEEVYGIQRTDSPPGYCDEALRMLLFVYEQTFIYHMLYGWAYISPYHPINPFFYRQLVYINPLCQDAGGVGENPPFAYGYFPFGGITSSRSVCDASSVDWTLWTTSNFCGDPDLIVNITSTPQFL